MNYGFVVMFSRFLETSVLKSKKDIMENYREQALNWLISGAVEYHQRRMKEAHRASLSPGNVHQNKEYHFRLFDVSNRDGNISLRMSSRVFLPEGNYSESYSNISSETQ
eukprot:TRINITY_DN8523_c0_g1_i1.p2 TRINITY_DN8523_c0_g1~~TRINITY_DN8523_c0_g1_i1.p2  ORF type:complete len:109 (-),score=14.06 TRINITY_DN8523_c0_g1_i1:96-422(-)